MPAASAGSCCDPVEVSLRSALEAGSGGGGSSSSSFLDQQLISSAKRVLLTKIEYHPAEKEYSSTLKTLQAKYIHLNPNNNKSDNHNHQELCSSSAAAAAVVNGVCVGGGDGGGGGGGPGAGGSGSADECRLLDGDGIPTPRVVIHPSDNVKLGWLRVYKIGAGLANLGNTCFLNATLQCLTYTPPLVNHLIEFNEHAACCKNVGFCMMCELQRHIRKALDKNGEIIRPQCILQKLKSIAAHMTWGRQEDAHEFLHYMMESMISSSLNGYLTAKLDRISYETTVVNQIFGGYHRSQVICLRCKEKSDTYDHFMDIMLDIKNVPSLEKALEHFVQPEVLDNENAYMCPQCKQKCPAKKRFTIHRAPNITTFQLKRFDYSRSMGGKITKHVSFPEKFDMRSYMSQRQGPPIMYVLYAVLVHQGVSCNSGHYFCFVRNSNNLWYLMDDSKVRQVSLNVVLSQQAYLLFYIRLPNSGQQLKSPVHCNNSTRLPLTPVVSSSSNLVTRASNSCNILNGIAGNPVNESFVGVPLLRKPNILSSSTLMKPKPILPSTAISSSNTNSITANNSNSTTNIKSGPSATTPLSANREKITFDFKSSIHHSHHSHHHHHHAQTAMASAPSSTAASSNCNGQTDRPRLVMQIKNGKVYNYQQQQASSVWTSNSSRSNNSVVAANGGRKMTAGPLAAATMTTASSTVSSSLVPYPPDSSEESDQDNGGRFSVSRTGGCGKGGAVGKASTVTSKNVPEEATRTTMDPQLNATMRVPGGPTVSKTSKASWEEKRTGSDSKSCSSPKKLTTVMTNNGGGNNNVSVLPMGCAVAATDGGGPLTVVTLNTPKVNATSVCWVVADGSQQSPSVASEGSNTSVNSTTGWTVTDAQETTVNATPPPPPPAGSSSSKWTVTSAATTAATTAAANRNNSVGGNSSSSLKFNKNSSSSSEFSRKREECERDEGRRVVVVVASREQNGVVEAVVANGVGDGGGRRSLSVVKSAEDVNCCNGSGEASSRKRRRSEDDEEVEEEEQRSHLRLAQPSSMVNGHRKRGRRKKKRRKGLLSPPLPSLLSPSVGLAQNDGDADENDDDSKWKKRSGKRKEGSSESAPSALSNASERGPSPSSSSSSSSSVSSSSKTKRRRHSSSSSNGSNASYELEWVEKTKETLEKEVEQGGGGDGKGKTTFSKPHVQAKLDEGRGGGEMATTTTETEMRRIGDVKNGEEGATGAATISTPASNLLLLPSAPPPSSTTVVELLKRGGGHGFGEGVSSWDGGRSVVNKDSCGGTHENSYESWMRKCEEDYNDEYDRGKTKRFKRRRPPYKCGPNFSSNMFQRVQEFRVSEKNNFIKNRWHVGDSPTTAAATHSPSFSSSSSNASYPVWENNNNNNNNNNNHHHHHNQQYHHIHHHHQHRGGGGGGTGRRRGGAHFNNNNNRNRYYFHHSHSNKH